MSIADGFCEGLLISEESIFYFRASKPNNVDILRALYSVTSIER